MDQDRLLSLQLRALPSVGLIRHLLLEHALDLVEIRADLCRQRHFLLRKRTARRVMT